MTDMSIGENDPLTVAHMHWLGFKNINGAMTKEGYGEIQFYDGDWHYCVDDKAVKVLKTCKDLNDIYLNKK